MKFSISKLFLTGVSVCTLGIVLCMGTTPANADTYLGLTEELCMADAYLQKPGNKLVFDKDVGAESLNCTANDVEITQVIPVNANEECTPGEIFDFPANVYVKTNANERWDTTFYLPLTEVSPQVAQGNNDNCSIVLPIPDGEGGVANADLDADLCSDITKAFGPDNYILVNETITMLCTPDPNNPTKALFTYCAAWDNLERDNCSNVAGIWADGTTYTPGQIPNTKSKCKCDSFPIDVYIKPPAPDIVKSLGVPATLPEPGGDYTFTMSFTNNSKTSSMFITDLFDHVDIGGEGGFDEVLDLLGATTSVDPTNPATPEGVYLKDNSSCITNFNATIIPGEVGPEATFSCSFTVTIVDRDLPDRASPNDPAIPEDYDDAIKVVLEDKNHAPIVDGGTCTDVGLSEADGEHCSVLRTVQVTDLPPVITVSKTPRVDEVLEPGDYVTFDIVVTSTSGNYDDPLELTSLLDTIFIDLDGLGTCNLATAVLSLSHPYTCSFTEFIGGNRDDIHSNTVTAYAEDNEGGQAEASDPATININDVPSAITLTKTANPTWVYETGDDPNLYRAVDYTFEFCVKPFLDDEVTPRVDDVLFNGVGDGLSDNKFGDLTAECMVDTLNGNPYGPVNLVNLVLSPGDCARCGDGDDYKITKQLQGNAVETHTNIATIYGTDTDGQDVSDSDDAIVTFVNLPLDITPEFALKARGFVRLTNGGVDNATISALSIMDTALTDGAGSVAAGFEIFDETPDYTYESGDGPYLFCSLGTVIGPGETYECAFTIKLYPGFMPATDDISFTALGLDALVVTLENVIDGDETTETIGIEMYTVE